MKVVKFVFLSLIVLAVGEPAAAWLVDHLQLPQRVGAVIIMITLVAVMVTIWRWIAQPPTKEG